jgi:molybdopterin-synthase adenylyltransferase
VALHGGTDIAVLDFDVVKEVNRDRLIYATSTDAALKASKVQVLARGLQSSATAGSVNITAIDGSIVEPDLFSRALDADLIFCCVDRPWPRAVLNFIAYAHLIPVVDGGVQVHAEQNVLRGAEWGAHVAAPGRRCLECLGQYNPGQVALERSGLLDNPVYIAGLPPTDRLRRNENVFAFAMAAASADLTQMLRHSWSHRPALAILAPSCTTSRPAPSTYVPTAARLGAHTHRAFSLAATPPAWSSPATSRPPTGISPSPDRSPQAHPDQH